MRLYVSTNWISEYLELVSLYYLRNTNTVWGFSTLMYVTGHCNDFAVNS